MTLRGLWSRLREGYEAQLLQDAPKGPSRPSHFFSVEVRDPETGARSVVLQGPRLLPLGMLWLNPAFVQFGLPAGLIPGAASLVRLLEFGGQFAARPHGGILVYAGISFFGGLVWNTFLGRWLFK